MRKRKKYLPYFFLFLVSLVGIISYIFFVSPAEPLQVNTVAIPSTIPFFVLLFTVTFSLVTYLSFNRRRGLLTGAFVLGIFLLRFFGFDEWFHICILFTIVILIEVYYMRSYKPQKSREKKEE